MDALRSRITPFQDVDVVPPVLVDAVADARFVLIGEASHGTHEFHALRAALTRGLVAEHGFAAVAVEADWPDAARVGSYEDLFHELGEPRLWLDLRDPAATEALHRARLERAIGVIYRPETERISHWLQARLPAQFDVVVHVDETAALQPLDRTSGWDAGAEAPGTYPWAL